MAVRSRANGSDAVALAVAAGGGQSLHGPRHDRRSAVEGGRGHHHRGAVPRAPPAAQQGGLHAAVRRDLGAVRHASHRGVPTDTRPGETTAGEQ